MLKALLFFLLFTFTVEASIQQASSLRPIAHEIERSPQGTLLLLDIGGTLIGSPDAIFHTGHEGWRKQWFQQHATDNSKEEFAALVEIVENGTKNWILLDAAWPALIKKSEERGLKVAALTKVVMGPKLTGTRVEKLRTVGITLSDSLPELATGQTFFYREGVIETDASLKGPVLKEVLSQLASRPTKIIFVDDRIEQIRSVKETCEAENIPCTTFHYTAWASTPPTLDEKIADKQLRTLVQKREWISADEAARLIE